MRINNNMMAVNTHRQLNMNQAQGAKSLEKLSSGLRINRAGDDAAGLAISEKMRGQIRGLNQAVRNAQDGISLIQTGEGALNESHAILQRMRELAVQAATDTNTTADRGEIQKEFDELAKEMTRIADNTMFNGQKLLDGNFKSALHIGSNEGQRLDLEINKMDAEALKVGTGASDATSASASYQGISLAADAAGDAGNYTVTFADPGAAGGALTVAVDGSTITVDLARTADTTGNTAALTNQGLTFTAATSGTAGNSLAVEIVQGSGNDVALSGTVDAAGQITITLGTGATGTAVAATADQIAALTFTGDAGGLAMYAGGGTGQIATGSGSTTITTLTSTSLTGGTDDTTGAITSDVDAIVAAINGSAAGSLVTASGTGSTAVTAGTVTMAGGADAVAVGGISVSSQTEANTAIGTIDTAITDVSTQRSALGAVQNRLEHTISNLGTSSENLQAAESRIRDVDMAAEMMQFTKNNILQQAATAMLAQANQAPQMVLQLLR